MFLRVAVLHRLPAPHGLDCPGERVLPGPALREEPPDRTTVAHRREDRQLAGDVAVLPLLGELVRHVEQAHEVATDVHVAGGAGDRSDPLDENPESRAKLIDVHVRPGEQRAAPRRPADRAAP